MVDISKFSQFVFNTSDPNEMLLHFCFLILDNDMVAWTPLTCLEFLLKFGCLAQTKDGILFKNMSDARSHFWIKNC